VLVVAGAGRPLGLIGVGDNLRADAADAVATLRGAGLRVILLTGDNERAASRIAQAAGIDEVHAGILPEGKAALLRTLQERGMVAMVGDGINDAPALMQADVGIAMGGGTDIVIEPADIIILSNRLAALPKAREVSARSCRKMVQNVMLAFVFNGNQRTGWPFAERVDEDRGDADRHRHHRPDWINEASRRDRDADAISTIGRRADPAS
jgi:P-type Cu+ transporter